MDLQSWPESQSRRYTETSDILMFLDMIPLEFELSSFSVLSDIIRDVIAVSFCDPRRALAVFSCSVCRKPKQSGFT